MYDYERYECYRQGAALLQFDPEPFMNLYHDDESQ